MNRLGNTILSVVAVALIISVIGSVCDGNRGSGKLIRMVCALVLGIHILSGVMQLDFGKFSLFADDLLESADAAAANGNRIASVATAEIIKEKTEAYILDKANDLGAELSVEVFLSDDDVPIPVTVLIRGNASPYAKKKLEQMMASDLGIAKENQEWIGWN